MLLGFPAHSVERCSGCTVCLLLGDTYTHLPVEASLHGSALLTESKHISPISSVLDQSLCSGIVLSV